MGMPFLIPHLKSSFFGGAEKVGDGPKGDTKKLPGTEGQTKADKKAAKKEAAKKKKEEIAKKLGGLGSGLFDKAKGLVSKGVEKGKEMLQLGKQGSKGGGQVQGGRGRLKDRPEVQALLGDNKVDSGAGSLQNYAGYESGAPQTAMIPMPPQIIPVDQGGESGSSGGGSATAEDPFESLYVGGLV